MTIRRIRNFAPSPHYNPLSPQVPAGTGTSISLDQFEEAVVVDVIVNNEHPLFATDGYNVGMVQFRLLSSNRFRHKDNLHWALSFESNISQYPLKGEVVYIFRALNRFWYITKFNVSNKVTTQDIPELILENEFNNAIGGSDKVQYYNSRSAIPNKVPSTTLSETKLGKYFVENSNILRLKHLEGDIVYEGRSGQSIRFGTSYLDATINDITKKPFKSSNIDQSPNILIRVGQTDIPQKTTSGQFSQTIEDINNDKSSIWMVADQIIPIKLSTANSGVEGASVPNFPSVFDGNQIVINSNRLIFNAKTNEIFGNAYKGIHWTTLENYTIDADGNYTTWVTKNRSDRTVGDWKLTTGGSINTSVANNFIHIIGTDAIYNIGNNLTFVANKIHVGSTSEDEPLVLGATLLKMLNQLIDILTEEPLVATTSVPGNPSPQNPDRVAKLNSIKQEFLSSGLAAKILSLNNFTTRKNDTPQTPRTISPYKEG